MTQNPYAPPAAAFDPPPDGPPLEPGASVDVIESVKFAFGRVGFGRLLLGLVLLIIPIVGPICLAGWMAETHRRLASRQSPPVLGFRFEQFGQYLMAGLVPFVAQMAVTMMVLFPLMAVTGIAAAVAIPMIAKGGASTGALLVLGLFGAILFTAVMLIMVVVVMVMQTRAELSGNFNVTFQPAGILATARRVWPSIVGHSLLLGLVAVPLMLLGLLALIVGVYVVAVALQFAQLHLRWQIHELDLRRGGDPIPIRAGNGADI
jgi:hypothetical protein